MSARLSAFASTSSVVSAAPAAEGGRMDGLLLFGVFIALLLLLDLLALRFGVDSRFRHLRDGPPTWW